MNEQKIMSILLEPKVTEKSSMIGELNNQYVFKVSKSATKPEIKKAIEEGYNGGWEISKVPHSTSEPVMNLYGGGLIMGKTDNRDRMVAAYQSIPFRHWPKERRSYCGRHPNQ